VVTLVDAGPIDAATAVARSVRTPIGVVSVLADGAGVRGVRFEGEGERGDWGGTRVGKADLCDTGRAEVFGAREHLDAAERALQVFFAGRDWVQEVPVVLAPAGTAFQREAWAGLMEIGFGETRAYRQQAELIGRPRAVRAVGRANGQNPIAVLLPCHRVIGADGSARGFGGGVERKRWLLAHEARCAGVALL
jgi:methylated-DNA-[protein]-cysteine S-methyltransferase